MRAVPAASRRGNPLISPFPTGASMTQRRSIGWRSLLAGSILAAGVAGATAASASAAVTATFSNGALTVIGDSLDNNLTVSRDAAGKILVNGGAVAVIGGTP